MACLGLTLSGDRHVGEPRVIAIDDPLDERVALFRRNERGLANRPQRRDDAGAGLFIAEGDLVVERALGAGCVPTAALVDGERVPPIAAALAERNVPVYSAGTAVRAAVTGLAMPQPIVALFERPARPKVAELAERFQRIVIVEAVDNPVNVGGIVRNAAGLGWQAMILDHTSADPLSRRALRVSMGHGATMPHARTADLVGAIQSLVERGVQVVALTPAEPSVDIRDVVVGERVALIIGAERTGISGPLLEAASIRARIPMHAGVDSLNAAAASAVACWALRP